MAQTTIHHHGYLSDEEHELAQRERLRSLLPTVASVALLLAVAFGFGLLLEDLASFGAWLLAQS